MKSRATRWDETTILNTAIIAGLVAVFCAIATPLVRGAILRQRTAECARKIMQAADAFDFYAAAVGCYPPSFGISQQADKKMRDVFSVFNIDWWGKETELGGQWNWRRGENESCLIIISGLEVSERRMARLDALLDDGDLKSGLFQRRGEYYCYGIRCQGTTGNKFL